MSQHAPPQKKASEKSGRTRAREFALQALYQHLVGRNDAAAIDAFTRDLSGFHKADSAHYDALLHGCIAESALLDEAITPLLDRGLAEISPVERAVLWIGAYEFKHCVDVPWRVVINECIELASPSAAPTATSTSTACSISSRPSCAPREVARDPARKSHSA